MTEFEREEDTRPPIIETADDVVLHQIQGHAWLGNKGLKLTLPSGKTIGSEEAQAFSSLFDPQTAETDEE